MMRSRFDEQLKRLDKELIEMGAMCEEAIALAAKALLDGDESLAAKVAPLDTEIDKMITDMERIGDQAADIAEIIVFLKGRSCESCAAIGEMGRATIKMVTDSVEAFVRRDTALAESVIRYDDIVDDYFLKVKTALIGLLARTPDDGEYALDLLMIAKYFERIGDHAVNIAEWVVFSVTGVHKEEG